MNIRSYNLRTVVAWSLIGFLLGSAVWTLTVRQPCVGVADIYDFWRVMRPAGIEHIAELEKPGHFVVCTFRTGPAHLTSGISSASVAAWLAKHTGIGLSPGPGFMDLRQMGRVWLCVVIGIVAAGHALRVPMILLASLLYVLLDPGYLLFFNSFYADPAFFVAVFGIVIWAIGCGEAGAKPEVRTAYWWGCSGFVVALLLLGGASKMQYVLFPAVALLCFGPLVVIGAGGPRWRAWLLCLVFCSVSVAAPLLFFFGPAPRFLTANNYHAVFGGIVKVASNPDAVLESLQVPSRFRDLPRTDLWSGGVGMTHPVHRHLRDLSRTRLLALYLTDPPALERVAAEVEASLTTVETTSRGNLVRSEAGPSKGTYSNFWQASRLHAALYSMWPPVVWVIIVAALARGLAAVAAGGRNGIASAMLFLSLWISSQLVVIVLGEGLINLKAHLVGTRLALDFLLVLLIWEAALWIGRVHMRAARLPAEVLRDDALETTTDESPGLTSGGDDRAE